MKESKSIPDFATINRKSWNDRVESHVDSDFYDMQSFLQGKTSLNEEEINLLGDVNGLSLLHLQCHFGQDTLSLARMGAKATGVDLSDQAINQAKKLNEDLGLDAEFVCCNLYDLPEHLDAQFDRVFTSYGTIGWLPDLEPWAALVARYLKPGGQFVMVDFHPTLWMFDDDFSKIQYRYFNSDPIIETQTGTYADRESGVEIKDVSWNHSMSSLLTSLMRQGLELSHFGEYDYSNYSCFNHLEEFAPGKFRVKHLGNKIPMMYSIVATKPL
ncbi:class I SAM-dependent methyltransferase [bacterium SCSIO 12741]|nr:class I SAM-dependent methyltransferase [bacterium SCSIO 12741]